jgi:ribosomal protein L37AE/L43A
MALDQDTQDDPDDIFGLMKRAREAAEKKPEPNKCPKGHTTGVKEIGCGRYMCILCGRKWTL